MADKLDVTETARNDADLDLGTFAAFDEFDESIESVEALGIDSGATLVKLCVKDREGALHFATWPSPW